MRGQIYPKHLDWSSALGELRDRLQGTLLTTFVGVVISLVVSPTIELFVTLCSSLSSKDVSFDDYQQCVNTTQYPLTSPLAPNALASSDVVLGNVSDLRAIMDVLTIIVFVVPLVDMYLHYRGTWNHVAAWVLCKQVYFCTHDCGLLCYRPSDSGPRGFLANWTWSPHRCLWLSWYLFAFVSNFSLVFLAVFVSVGVTYEDVLGDDHPLFGMYISLFAGSLTTVFLVSGILTASRFLLSMILVSHPWKDVDARDSEDDPVIYRLAPSSIQKLTPYGVRAFCDVDFSLKGTGAYFAGFPRGFVGKTILEEGSKESSCFKCASWCGCCWWTGTIWTKLRSVAFLKHYPDLVSILFSHKEEKDKETALKKITSSELFNVGLCHNCQNAFRSDVIRNVWETSPKATSVITPDPSSDTPRVYFTDGEWVPLLVRHQITPSSPRDSKMLVAYQNLAAKDFHTGYYKGRLDFVRMEERLVDRTFLLKHEYPKSAVVYNHKLFSILVCERERTAKPSDAATTSGRSEAETPNGRSERLVCLTHTGDSSPMSVDTFPDDDTVDTGRRLFLQKIQGDVLVIFSVKKGSSETGVTVTTKVSAVRDSSEKGEIFGKSIQYGATFVKMWTTDQIREIGIYFTDSINPLTDKGSPGRITLWDGSQAFAYDCSPK